MRDTILIFVALIIAFIAAVIVIFSRQVIYKPINQMLEAVENLRAGEGDLTLRLPDFGSNEIGLTAKQGRAPTYKLERERITTKPESNKRIGKIVSQSNITVGSIRTNASGRALENNTLGVPVRFGPGDGH